MPDYTPNIGLQKPQGSERVTRANYVENLDILDEKLALAANLTEVNTALQEHIDAENPHTGHVLTSDFAAHLADTVQDGVHGISTTQNMTYYVNVATGSDANDGLTGGTAFKTIQKAIDQIPIIAAHDITINVAPGTYGEDLQMYNSNGRAKITIQGGANLEQASNYKINSIGISAWHVETNIIGFEFVSTAAGRAGVSTFGATYVKIISCKDVVSASTGIQASEGSSIQVTACEISNKSTALACFYRSTLFSSNNSGTGNGFGIYCAYTSTVGKQGTQPSGTTAEYTSEGGEIR